MERAILSAGAVFSLRRFLIRNRQRKVKYRELERRTQHLHLRLPVGAFPTGRSEISLKVKCEVGAPKVLGRPEVRRCTLERHEDLKCRSHEIWAFLLELVKVYLETMRPVCGSWVVSKLWRHIVQVLCSPL